MTVTIHYVDGSPTETVHSVHCAYAQNGMNCIHTEQGYRNYETRRIPIERIKETKEV